MDGGPDKTVARIQAELKTIENGLEKENRCLLLRTSFSDFEK